MVTQEKYGCLNDGTEVIVTTLSNIHGEEIKLLNYGASIYSAVVRDGQGHFADIVLGPPSCEALETFPFLGATIGRCANRIANGRFQLDGKEFQLEQNMRGHFLHGGSENYAHRLFSVKPLYAENGVEFSLTDAGACGFGCAVQVTVTYYFDDSSRLTMLYHAVPEEDTVISLTNHTYFHLNSGEEDAGALYLRIHAQYEAEKDADGVPTGQLLRVDGTPADFRRDRTIRSAMDSDDGSYFQNGRRSYDNYYQLDDKPFALAAELNSKRTGLSVKVYTDQPALVLFCGKPWKPTEGKNGELYDGYCFVCLEPGFLPNAVNCPAFDSPVVRKGESYRAKTVYEFQPLQMEKNVDM